MPTPSRPSVQQFVATLLENDGIPPSMDPEPTASNSDVTGDIEAAIQELLAANLAELTRTDENGTRHYQLKIDEPRTDAELVVHAADQPDTWDYERLPWYVETSAFHDRGGLSPAGSELEGIDDAEDIIGWVQNRLE